MTQMTVPEYDGAVAHPLVTRLTRLRGRVRLVVGLFGLGVLIAGAISGMFLLVLADYVFHIPASLRVLLLIAWIAGLGVLAWRMLFLPLTTRLTDRFLASRVENLHKDLSDELMSAVQFIHMGAGQNNVLAARHIDMAAQRTAGMRFEEALDYRPAGKSMGLALLAAVIVGAIALLNPGLARVAWSRWFSTHALPWPRTTHVAFDWSSYGGKPPKAIPLGEKFTVRAKVDQGSLPRVWLYYWMDGGRTMSQLMTHQKEQDSGGVYVFETALEPEGKQLSLRVDAGDDHDEEKVVIGMVPRPVITQLQGIISPPPYVKDVKDPTKPVPAVEVNLLSQAARAAQGANVTLHVRATKDFQLNDKGEPELRLFDQNKDQELALAVNRRRTSGSEAELLFIADKTLQARLMMRDTDGFENRVGGSVAMEVVPDALPSIVITDPRRSVERAPTGFVEMEIQGTDDWGFRGLKLRAEKFDAKEGEPPVFETDLTWQELTVDHAAGNTTGKTKYTWDLSPLNLQPGARLTFFARVQDNYDLNGQQHDWVKSAPLSLVIRSAAEIQEAQRKSLAELNERLKGLKLLQEQTRTQTDSIRRMVTDSKVMTAEQRTQLGNLSQQQTQESATATAIQQRAGQIADDLRQNKMGDGELGKIAQEVSGGMQDVGQQNMPRAAAELSKSQESSGTQDQAKQQQEMQQSAQSMQRATGQQDQAIATMDRLITRLGATGDFDTLKADTAKLLAKQQDLGKETRQLAPRTAGTNRDALPPDVRNTEDKLAREQKDLKDQTADVLNRMEQAVQQLSQSDPASSQSLQNAAQAGRNGQVTQSQGSASDAISTNKLNDANNNQAAASQTLQQMMDELNKNDLRKLEQLVRDIRRLIEDVQKLRDDQLALKKDTETAGAAGEPAMQKLGNRQGTLQQNAIIIQKKAESTPRAGQAAAFIGEASDDMVLAATALYSNKQPDSLDPQTKAIGALELAIAELKKIEQQIAPNLKNKQLGEYIKQYEQVKKDQMAVKDSSDKFEAKRQAAVDQELDRLDEEKVVRLAKTQDGLIDQINGLSKDDKLKEYEVIVWMNSQVTEAMGTSKGKLEKAQLGPQLAGAQQTAIDRIQMIIDSLREEQEKSEFNNGGGGGGGGGQRPLVPPEMQLRMLKAMQLVVNTQTKSVNDNLKNARTDAERNEDQTQAQELGEKQGQIRDIADHLMQKLTR